MGVQGTPFDTALSRAADESGAIGEDFRGRAEGLLQKANATEDAATRTELVIKAAILHHLAVMRETGRAGAPFGLQEAPNFCKTQIEAQLLGQAGDKRGLRGGTPYLQRAHAAYRDAESAEAGSGRREH